jgi:hypothetical protein
MEQYAVSLMIFISFLTPIAAAITEVIKQTFKEIHPRFYTIMVIVISLVLAAVSYSFTDLDLTLRLWGGLFAGLAAAKVYDITKSLANSSKK